MLAGNLADFSIEDIFGLLAQTRKSGALRVEIDGRQARVWFSAGEVCLAVADVHRMGLGARMLDARLVSADQLRQLPQGDPLSFVRQLVGDGLVHPGELGPVLRDQVEDAVGRLLRVTEGSFAFDHSVAMDDWPAARYGAEELLSEGRRRAGEWESVAAQLPSLDGGLGLVPALPAGHEEFTLSRAQWHLIALVDGHRSARDLSDVTGLGELATYQTIGGLVAAGLVELRPDGAATVGEIVAGPERTPVAVPDDGAPQEEAADTAPAAPLDPAAMARELASLGLPMEAFTARPTARAPKPRVRFSDFGDEAQPATPPRPRSRAAVVGPAAAPVVPRPEVADEPLATAEQRLARDEDVNRGLLLRLIDGVKGA